ncbi:unnamed protein product [Linum tenue]|uniref:Uncharacterized protein n=1 Tax=Linum tenue TaxID=586396 RepID=A0AAV0LNQ2_9ROSI|nr:unnamed protein product [Linum tenue]
MNNQGAAHPRLVTPPSIKLSPHSSYHRLPVPPSFSLFYWLFSRVPDTLVLMLITIAFFIIHLTTFYYTKFFKKRACILAIRPSTDFNLVNGLLISLLTYIIRVLHHGTIAGYCVGLSPSAPAAAPSPSMAVAPSCVDPRLGPSSPYPWLLMVGCFSIAGLLFYLESRGLNADEEGLREAEEDVPLPLWTQFGNACAGWVAHLMG